MSLPYMPLFVDDYEADTAHLSLIEDGIYNRLLRLCWRTPKCRLPNDMDWIARKIRATSDDDLAAMKVVLDEFFTAKRGYIFSKRLSAEYERICAIVQRRSEAGKIASRQKSLKNNKNNASNRCSNVNHPEPYPDKDTTVSFKRARARKKKGYEKPRNIADAAVSFIEEMENEQGRESEIGEGIGSDVQLLSAIGHR